MRTTHISLLSAIALTALSGCTVKDVDAPPLAGPSTFAHSIVLFTERDTLTQNGVDFTDIRITSLSPTGVSETIPVRAQIFVDGVAQDFGTLSTKNPTTPATIRYTAPPASNLAAAQVPQTVTIAVTPTSSGDFRSEFARQIDLRLEPQGIIQPSNPNLVASFTVLPTNSPLIMTTVTFDASSTTNGGVACLTQCTYAWNFGDGTTGAGMNVTHEFRTVGNFLVTLTVTDSRGATATATQTVLVQPGALPTVDFSFSPSPVGANQDVFFSAEASTAVPPRRIVRYDWDFGDGGGGSGVSTTHRYRAIGTYTVILTVTDDAGASNRVSKTISVQEGLPTVTLAVTGLKVGGITQLIVQATPATGSTIAGYTINWGDGSPEEFSDNPANTHVYTSSQVFTIVVRTTDSIGRTRVSTISASVQP